MRRPRERLHLPTKETEMEVTAFIKANQVKGRRLPVLRTGIPLK